MTLMVDIRYAGSPAHAGIDRCLPALIPALIRFPRTRGDRPPFPNLVSSYAKVPPHTRG